jgi:uncharacterized phage protein gp47/JayE
MNINEIISSVNSNLIDLGSKLANFSRYSNVYALVRSISQTYIEQQDLLNTNLSKSFISQATGDDLDLKLTDLGINRLTGSLSSGWVLASSSSTISIPQGTVLSDLSKSHQFTVDSTTQIGINEVSLRITSLIIGESSNLEANTQLFNPLFSNSTFFVGRYRDPLSNAAIISLSGGSDRESDESYRARGISSLSNINSGNLAAVDLALRQNLNSIKFYIKEARPVTGMFTVFVNSSEESIINLAEQAIEKSKPLGINYIIQTIQKQPVSIIVNAVIDSSADSQSAINAMRSTINNYFNNLTVGQSFSAPDLERRIIALSPIREVLISLSGDYFVNPEVDFLPTVGNIAFNIRVV